MCIRDRYNDCYCGPIRLRASQFINSALPNWFEGSKDMSRWTSSVFSLLLLLQTTTQSQAQQSNDESVPILVEEAGERSEESPTQLILAKKDWSLTRAYFDVFK